MPSLSSAPSGKSFSSGLTRFRERVARKIRSETTLFILFAIVIGILIGAIAVLFRILIDYSQNALEALHDRLTFSKTGFFFLLPFVFIPAFGGLLVGLITYYICPEASGGGVGLLLKRIIENGGRFPKRLAPAKMLATAITLGSGGSGGREAPIALIGASIASNIGERYAITPYEMKVLIGCGVSAAVSASFNAPLGGIFFAIEVILLELRTKSFVPIAISSVTAAITSRIYRGEEALFVIPPYSLVHPFEIVSYAVLGVVAGGFGLLLIKGVIAANLFFKHLKLHPVLKPALGGLCVGIMGIFVPEVMGQGYLYISRIVNTDPAVSLWESAGFRDTAVFFFILAILKIIATAITIESGGSAGTFFPALFIGSTIGGGFGAVVHTLFPAYTGGPGAYALVGMASVFAASSRATITAILIIFEMAVMKDTAGAFSIVLPLIFSSVIADLIASKITRDTIFTYGLVREGLRVAHDMAIDVLAVTTAVEAMVPIEKLEPVSAEDTLEETRRKINSSPARVQPVFDSEKRFKGFLDTADLTEYDSRKMYLSELGEKAEDEGTGFAGRLINHKREKGIKTEWVRASASLSHCLAQMKQKNVDYLVVYEVVRVPGHLHKRTQVLSAATLKHSEKAIKEQLRKKVTGIITKATILEAFYKKKKRV